MNCVMCAREYRWAVAHPYAAIALAGVNFQGPRAIVEGESGSVHGATLTFKPPPGHPSVGIEQENVGVPFAMKMPNITRPDVCTAREANDFYGTAVSIYRTLLAVFPTKR